MAPTDPPPASRPAIIVTGASSGIGRELALTAPGEVVLVARSKGALASLAAEIAATGRKAHVLALDLGVSDAAGRIEAFMAEQGLYCDVLVNNAGYGLIGKADQLDRADQIAMADLNMRALADLSLLFLPGMLARGRGGVLNVASVAGFMPGPNMAMYYATKAFVRSFSEALWQEGRRRGVTVTALCPGPVATAFFQRAAGGAGGGLAAAPKLFRLMPGVTAREVAEQGWAGFSNGKRLVIPGWMNRIAVTLVPLLPTRLVLSMVARFQKSRV